MKWKWRIKKIGRNFRVNDKKDEFVLTAYFLKQLYPLFKGEADKKEIDEAIWLILKNRYLIFYLIETVAKKKLNNIEIV